MSNPFARTYKKLLDKHFLLVQAAQTGLLMGTGDFIAQTFFEKQDEKKYNFKRTLQFASLGVIFVGPALTTWYRFMAKHITSGSASSIVLKKVAADQLLFAPTFLGLFIPAVNLINGFGLEHIKKEINFKYFDILLTNYKIWPAVQLFNFYVLPLHYQVLLVQVVAIFWNAYLSWKTQHERVKQKT